MPHPRLRWMIQSLADSFQLDEKFVEDNLTNAQNFQKIDDFLAGKGPQTVLISYQNTDGTRALFVNDDVDVKPIDKSFYFYRNVPEGKPVNTEQSCDLEVLFGELLPNTMIQSDSQSLYQMLSEVQNWSECDEESKIELLNATKKFMKDSAESITDEGVFITTFDRKIYKEKGGHEKERVDFLQLNFARWLDEVETHLQDPNNQRYDAGPRTELLYWKERMQKITNLSKELKSVDFKFAKEELKKDTNSNENIQNLMTRYNLIDSTITNKINEAKDNVKYLTAFDKFIEPLYTGKPQEIVDALPALMSAIKMIYAIAKYYNTNEKMTNLFVKVTNQMINNCKAQIQQGKKDMDKIWDRNPEDLLNELEDCLRLNYAYQKEYNVTKNKINDVLKERQFDLNTVTIFGKFDLFCRRVKKLIDIFSTIQQFNALKKQGIEGIDDITEKFDVLISTFREKKYDLLDFQNNKFDRHYVQYNVDRASLQEIIDNIQGKPYCIKMP